MKTVIIAEAATNHGGDISLAREMVHAAKEAGADVIKFQSWRIATMDKSNPAYTIMCPKELNDEAHFRLIEECRKTGIGFLTTVFDKGRIGFLSSLNLQAIKVASTDVGSLSMLRELRKTFPVIYLSTGMSTPDEVTAAVNVLKIGSFHLMHCVSIYPTPPEKANLARIDWLRRFTPNVGYSDHTAGNNVAKIALAMGVTLLEKHFTLKQDPENVFSRISALPRDIREIADYAADCARYRGNGSPEIQEEEKKSRDMFIGRWGDNTK